MSENKFEFKTEVNQILDLMIHSLYSHKEIFLRELVSNASDAIEKLRLESLSNEDILESDSNFKIKIYLDKNSKTVKISDNGLGMSKEEVIKNLGTIAHSNTKEFLKYLKEKNIESEAELIGQFGVGFYSSFMVADKVTVVTKRAGKDSSAVIWESKADGFYTVTDTEKSGRGTDVILHLKDDALDYLEEWEIRTLIKKYSDFIEFPIVIDVEKESTVVKGEKIKEEETLNSQKALWLRSKNEIKQTEYCEFYKHISHDYNDPLEIIHYNVEGLTEFTALLFIPKKVPFGIFHNHQKIGPMLYVKRVQIMENCEELLPPYLRFVKGVVESSDLPLNVSREILQSNKKVETIKKSLVSKILDTLKNMKKSEYDKYLEFYLEFGKILKEGIHIDFANKEDIASILLFESTETESGKFTTLDDYIKNMKADQNEIYYISGSKRKDLENSPYLEAFKGKNFEILFFTDEIDDFIMSGMMEYKGKKFKSATKGEIDIEKNKDKEKEKDFKDFIDFMKDKLQGKVEDVRFSGRLTNSPCCLVTREHDIDPQMAKLFEAMGQKTPEIKRTLEINPNHKLIEKLNQLYKNDKSDKKLDDFTQLLFEHALILEGSKPENGNDFVNRVIDIMVDNLK